MHRHRQLAKQRVYNDSDYLLIRRNVPEEYLETRNEELRKLTGKAITEIYRKLAEKAHKNTPPRVWGLIRSHNIRKFFNSALLNAGADSFTVDFWMGHIQDSTRAAYFRASAESGLKELYIQYIPYITIEKSLDPSEHPDFIRLKKESETYARAAANAAVERNELIELRVEMEKMKQEREIKESLRTGYSQFVDQDFEEIQKMKTALKQELEEISILKETLLKAKK